MKKYAKAAVVLSLAIAAGCDDFIQGPGLTENPNNPVAGTAQQQLIAVQARMATLLEGQLAHSRSSVATTSSSRSPVTHTAKVTTVVSSPAFTSVAGWLRCVTSRPCPPKRMISCCSVSRRSGKVWRSVQPLRFGETFPIRKRSIRPSAHRAWIRSRTSTQRCRQY
jgi:hypothetical protein